MLGLRLRSICNRQGAMNITLIENSLTTMIHKISKSIVVILKLLLYVIAYNIFRPIYILTISKMILRKRVLKKVHDGIKL